MSAAIYIQNSKNRKLASKKIKVRVDATYAPIEKTCSDTCAMKKDNTCYAKTSYVGITNARLTKRAKKLTALQVARQEAQAIDNSYNAGSIPANTFLRLHVSGDSRTVKGSKLINSAVGRWKKRGGTEVWSYTHSWRNVPAKVWSNVNMLASVDRIQDADLAIKNGYAPALVVGEHLSDKAYTLDGSSVKWIPCPAQLKEDEVGCADCKLCMKTNYLVTTNHGIAFAAHGVGAKKIKRRLNVITS